jgi:hypothetical protein
MNTAQISRSVTAAHVVGAESGKSAVSWAAIIAGAMVAAAVSLLLVTIGSGLELLTVSPWAGSGVAAAKFTFMTAIWFIVIQWLASGVGGYLTGRLRAKWVSTHTHEVFFRDTAHGFITWALASILVMLLLASAAASLVSGGARTAELATAATEGDAAYDLDLLFRRSGSEVNAAVSGPDPRPQALRIAANSLASADASVADRAYLAALVAARTGIAQAEAEQRVTAFITQIREAADKARKASATIAIFTAISMLVGAFIACVAAAVGGRRRDSEVPTLS